MAGPKFPYRVVPQESRIIPFEQLATYHAAPETASSFF